jgi:hypothetical protein
MCSACSGDYQYDDTDALEVILANPLAASIDAENVSEGTSNAKEGISGECL